MSWQLAGLTAAGLAPAAALALAAAPVAAALAVLVPAVAWCRGKLKYEDGHAAAAIGMRDTTGVTHTPLVRALASPVSYVPLTHPRL